MVKDICSHCDRTYFWDWEEAFDKFGFGDGDSIVETEKVKDALSEAGYNVKVAKCGLHNTIIVSIVKDGEEQIPETIHRGYDDPRDFLPETLVNFLDEMFPSDKPYQI